MAGGVRAVYVIGVVVCGVPAPDTVATRKMNWKKNFIVIQRGLMKRNWKI